MTATGTFSQQNVMIVSNEELTVWVFALQMFKGNITLEIKLRSKKLLTSPDEWTTMV
jgi:hypothetical protein